MKPCRVNLAHPSGHRGLDPPLLVSLRVAGSEIDRTQRAGGRAIRGASISTRPAAFPNADSGADGSTARVARRYRWVWSEDSVVMGSPRADVAALEREPADVSHQIELGSPGDAIRALARTSSFTLTAEQALEARHISRSPPRAAAHLCTGGRRPPPSKGMR